MRPLLLTMMPERQVLFLRNRMLIVRDRAFRTVMRIPMPAEIAAHARPVELCVVEEMSQERLLLQGREESMFRRFRGKLRSPRSHRMGATWNS